MTIREVRDDHNRYRIKMVECPVCDNQLDEQQGFADHWPNDCPDNPEVEDAE